ncbi:MAG TPA: UTP--glucose-1-phosphate uridylyltransferase GalU [Burkholderiaceae bacterium]|nr:UTP--glucose-1-phosphate uridylyltransferase GalU [Burkholderiaceae bacterium]
MTQKIRKAVFPVAGLGTRFLPVTKAMPKEMLPVVDKPLIQYAAEEAIAAGIEELIFITGRHKRAIEDHFDAAPELEAELAARNKHDLLRKVRHTLPAHIKCIYIRQSVPLGLGHAVLCAEPVVGREPFAVLLADDLIDAEVPVTRQLIEDYERYQASVIGVQDVPRQETSKYGIVAATAINARTARVQYIVEKPSPASAPSTLAVMGRYILEPEIFDELHRIERGAGGEVQLTDGIARLLAHRPVVTHRFRGRRFDCGTKRGFWEATMVLGMRNEEVGPHLQRSLEQAVSASRAAA